MLQRSNFSFSQSGGKWPLITISWKHFQVKQATELLKKLHCRGTMLLQTTYSELLNICYFLSTLAESITVPKIGKKIYTAIYPTIWLVYTSLHDFPHIIHRTVVWQECENSLLEGPKFHSTHPFSKTYRVYWDREQSLNQFKSEL